MRCALALVAAVATGCLSPASPTCANGSTCGPGTTCIVDLDVCATDEQLAVCRLASEGDACETATIQFGRCTSGVCLSSGCGNRIIEDGEACDDGNVLSGDGCSANCSSDETCGNKLTDPGEDCDCGTVDDVKPECGLPNSDLPGSSCTVECRDRCGDGIVSSDEACDPNAPGANAVSCAGVLAGGVIFDRGITTCADNCQPLVTVATCRYIGWRSRTPQPIPAIVDVAVTGPNGHGFFAAGEIVNSVDNFTMPGAIPFDADAAMAAVWAVDDTAAIAVGARGTIVHYDGTTWSKRPSGTTVDLVDVWARSSSDAYAVGRDVVLHWNGTSWSSLGVPPGAYRAIAVDATKVYVAGDVGKVLVHDGAAWTVRATGTTADLRGIWSADGFVVAVGANGTIVQDAGAGFVRGRTSVTVDLSSVYAVPGRGFFAAGERGTLVFFDGRVWRPIVFGRGVTSVVDQNLHGLAAMPDGRGFGVIGAQEILTYEGAAWSPTVLPTANTINGLWGSAPDDVFAVGRNGTILHHDGLTWSEMPSPTTLDLYSIWGLAPDDVYAVGDDFALLHYDGFAWQLLHSGPADSSAGDFRGVWAASGTDVFATGVGQAAGIFRYDGVALTRMSSVKATSIWGTSANDVFAASPTTPGGGLHHYNGIGWSSTAANLAVRGVSGTSSNDVYAVGTNSYHYDGDFTLGPFDEDALAAVFATADHGVFATGLNGTLRHATASGVEPFVSRTTTDLVAVWVTGNVVFMAGTDGTLDVMVFHE